MAPLTSLRSGSDKLLDKTPKTIVDIEITDYQSYQTQKNWMICSHSYQIFIVIID
jgi:hypothetical protein